MGVFDAEEFNDHEQVVFGRDAEAALVAIVAIHDTSLGPALGGCRMWPYASEREALADVLRLSKAMTYKHALAGTAQGGGKAVIIADPKRDKSPALWHALGRLVDGLSGRYIVAEDVGTSVEDMALVHEATPHVAGIADGGSGDPSPMTAWGVFCGIKAAVHHKLGRDDLAGLRIAVQGLGHVGHALCGYLHEAGARLLVSDIDEAAVASAVADFGAEAVAAERVHAVEAEVFAPCALGGVLNQTTIPEIKAPIVAGTANNQLSCAADGEALAARGVLYAPDYAINAGGVVNISFERDGYDAEKAMARTAKIYDTLTAIFERADAEGLATNLVADRMARERIEKARASTRETNPAVKRG